MFHSRIIGAKSANLDHVFFSDDTLTYLLAKNATGCEISVIEGVMGFYDGMGLTTTKGSTYDISRVTKSPVILVVNAKGASLSILAVIRGFLDFASDTLICGVILNQCSAMTYPVLAEEIRKQFEGRIRPLGYLPSIKEGLLESRHLGLVTADEVKDLKEKMQALAIQAERSLDLDGILGLAEQAAAITYSEPECPHFEEPVRIGVARDQAFCFYYEDSLELLEEMGAELVPFSPLYDCSLPENLHGLYLGGGYPELYARTLSANTSMRTELKERLENRTPCIAECGGFMYLTDGIRTKEGNLEPMVGYLKGTCFDTGKLTRFGYVSLTAQKNQMLCESGESICGHEFHYWDCEKNGTDFLASKSFDKSWECVVANDHLYAGFPHFHFYSNPKFAEHFYRACLLMKHNTEDRS